MSVAGQQTSLVRAVVAEEVALRIEVRDRRGAAVGHLSPLTRSSLADESLIDQLTRWRNRARGSFLTQFTATPQRTRGWLEKVVLADPARLFFLVHAGSKRVGQYGFRDLTPEAVELDNLLRGERGGGADFFRDVERALVAWLFERCGVRTIYGHVLSDNELTLELHRATGFRPGARIPLEREERDGDVHWVPRRDGKLSPGGIYLQHIELDRADFQAARLRPGEGGGE